MPGLGLSRPFALFFQHAYVTNDLDQAIAEFGSRWEVPRFVIRERVELVCGTPRGVESVLLRLAFAYVGTLQIELIQPLGGPAASFYTDVLPGRSFAVRFHHMGFLVETGEDGWARCVAGVAEDGYEVALSNDNARLRFIYVDTRPQLGHYCEFILPKMDLFADVPRN